MKDNELVRNIKKEKYKEVLKRTKLKLKKKKEQS